MITCVHNLRNQLPSGSFFAKTMKMVMDLYQSHHLHGSDSLGNLVRLQVLEAAVAPNFEFAGALAFVEPCPRRKKVQVADTFSFTHARGVRMLGRNCVRSIRVAAAVAYLTVQDSVAAAQVQHACDRFYMQARCILASLGGTAHASWRSQGSYDVGVPQAWLQELHDTSLFASCRPI